MRKQIGQMLCGLLTASQPLLRVIELTGMGEQAEDSKRPGEGHAGALWAHCQGATRNSLGSRAEIQVPDYQLDAACSGVVQ